MDTSNLPLQPAREILLDEQSFLTVVDALVEADVIDKQDPLSVTLCANSLYLYSRCAEDLAENPTSGVTEQKSDRMKDRVIRKRDARVEAHSRLLKDLQSCMRDCLLPASSRLKLIAANKTKDDAMSEFFSLMEDK